MKPQFTFLVKFFLGFLIFTSIMSILTSISNIRTYAIFNISCASQVKNIIFGSIFIILALWSYTRSKIAFTLLVVASLVRLVWVSSSSDISSGYQSGQNFAYFLRDFIPLYFCMLFRKDGVSGWQAVYGHSIEVPDKNDAHITTPVESVEPRNISEPTIQETTKPIINEPEEKSQVGIRDVTNNDNPNIKALNHKKTILVILLILMLISLAVVVLVGYNYFRTNDTKEIVVPNYEAVDLGLSVKWCNKNLGARSLEDAGKFFAWGSLIGHYKSENHIFSDENYLQELIGANYYSDFYDALNNGADPLAEYCYHTSIKKSYPLPFSHDAARQILHGEWRMPTLDEFNELREYCTWEWVDKNSTKGYLVTSRINNKSIFLPACGMGYDDGFHCTNQIGMYWSANSGTFMGGGALQITEDNIGVLGINSVIYCHRPYGFSIRPVCE